MDRFVAFVSLTTLGLSLSVIAADGGIEQATGTAPTRARACESALQSAEFAANNKGLLSITVTKKKCECDEDKNQTTGSPIRWSCVGLVAWQRKER
jgi:hypothetical protein